jgi:hypothetical protein
MASPTIARTDWAELQVEDLLSVPLVSEFVFRSPKHNDPDENEVIDHLIVHRQQSIIISQKAQDDPEKRSVPRNELWVLKNIQNALKPMNARRTLSVAALHTIGDGKPQQSFVRA